MTARITTSGIAGLGLRCSALGSLVFLAACAPMALTAVGVGSAAGVQHTMGGITYRTFTVPLPQVRSAAIASLNRMGIKVDSRDKSEAGEIIKASANGRNIEIEFDALTPNTTRMRTMVRNGLFMDASTGAEIIIQTERILSNGKTPVTAGSTY
jgi:hypothetical protein